MDQESLWVKMRRFLVILIGFLIASLIVLNVRADSSLTLKEVELYIEGPSYLLVKVVVKNIHSSQSSSYRLWIRAWLNSGRNYAWRRQGIMADRYASISNGSENVHWLTVPNDFEKSDNVVKWLSVELWELNGSEWLYDEDVRLYLSLNESRGETITKLLSSISELQGSIQNLQIQLILLISILGLSAAIIAIFLLRKYWKIKHIPYSVEAEWADKRL